MATITLTDYDAGATLYAFPVTQSLADWTDYRSLLTEGTGADVGRYVGSVDSSDGTQWLVFSGASQPSSWADALLGIGFDISSQVAATQATAAAISASTAASQSTTAASNSTLIKAKTDLIGTLRSLIRW